MVIDAPGALNPFTITPPASDRGQVEHGQEEWANAAFRRAVRETLAPRLDEGSPYLIGQGRITSGADWLARQSMGYRELFGLENTRHLKIGSGQVFESYSDLLKPKGREIMGKVLELNLRTARPFQVNPARFAWGRLADNVAPLAGITQRPWTGAMFGIAAGLSALPVITRTFETYQNGGNVAGVALQESLKAIVSWELGAAAFAAGVCLAPAAGLAVGILAGATVSWGASALLDKLFPFKKF